MLRNIEICAPEEALRVTENVNWNVILHELDKFIGLIITRGVSGQRGLPLGLEDFGRDSNSVSCSMMQLVNHKCLHFLHFQRKARFPRAIHRQVNVSVSNIVPFIIMATNLFM